MVSRFLLLIAGMAMANGLPLRGAPSIEITNTPPFGSFENLAGRVTDADPAQHRVIVFIYVPSAGWWSKPYCNPQLTVIQPNGTWSADITTGGSDSMATKITAILVSTNYNEPCVEGPPVLPANVLAQAIGVASVERQNPNVRWIQFSGYDWWVKASSGLAGPGPNYFSAATNNVWVDAQGRLHLGITNRSNQWQCVEIVSGRSFGFGSYRFELGSNVNQLNPNAVLGLFTWSDDPAWAHREIDVECSRWGNVADVNNSQFVVQPWDAAGHLVRYPVPGDQTNSTHIFSWQTNQILFQCQRGGYVPNPDAAKLITNWVYALTVPQPGDENVRINLWLFNGNPPMDNNEVEFVINSFQFVPLGAPEPARLSDLKLTPAGQAAFSVTGQRDRRYQIEASTNLASWVPVQTVLATNNVFEVVEPNSIAQGVRFFRAATLP